MVSRTLLEGIASGRPTSLEQELFPQWLEQGSYIRVHVFGGRCIDIGTPERYREAQQSLANVELGSGVGERVRPFRGKDMTVDVLRGNLEESLKVHSQLIEACLPATTAAAEALVAAYRQGHKALFFGNGGSAADAQHLAAEFVGRYLREREPMPALALNTNSSAVTAIGNDYGYDQVFARQLQALAAPGDVAVAISTSGNSPNVIEAIKCARRLGLFTIALTGASGGKLRGLVNVLIAAPSDATPRIQECHILVGHALCDAVERAVANEPAVLGASSTVGN
jgi:D-sedoheptulose 7-phosphate isomerase